MSGTTYRAKALDNDDEQLFDEVRCHWSRSHDDSLWSIAVRKSRPDERASESW